MDTTTKNRLNTACAGWLCDRFTTCLAKAIGMCGLVLSAYVPAAGQVYEIPFASKANRVELTVANTSGSEGRRITVTATRVPEWITLQAPQVELQRLPGGAEQTVSFSFAASQDAPAGVEDTLRFTISENGRPLAARSYRLKSGAPQSFKLLNNYPNPFNPSTVITYQLPQASRVKVQVFDVLGRQVAELLSGQMPAGRHSLRWDAAGLASGVYIYRIVAKGQNGREFIRQKKMLLIK